MHVYQKNTERNPNSKVLHVSNVLFLLFNLACAYAPDVGTLIAFRFLAGLGGSTPIAVGAGVIGDMFSEQERGMFRYDT